MIKVLHVVSSLGRGSGVMSFIMNYYRLIDKEKYSFDFLYFYDVSDDFREEIESYGGSCYKICHPKKIISFRKKLKSFFYQNVDKYTIIHCHPIYSSFLISSYAKRKNIKHIIQHFHATKYSNKKLSAFRNRLIIFLSKNKITDYAACSVDSLKIIPINNKKNRKCFVINNGININDYKYNNFGRNSIRQEFNIEKKSFVIGNVGRFSSEKNQKIIIEIFHKFNKKYPDSNLILTGEGSLLEECRNFVKSLDLEDKVFFTGVRSDIGNILSAMDVFILASEFEGFGIVALEAQANGLLTICSNGVPDCVILTNNANKMNVYGDENEMSIVEYMINNLNYNRNIDLNSLYESDYNIVNCVKKLENFYFEISGDDYEKK